MENINNYLGEEMETIKVRIVMGDEDYGYALGEALKRNYSGFIISLGQGDAGDEADIHLFDDLRRRGKNSVFLTEKYAQVDDEKYIYYKYDSGRNIAGSILSAYSRLTGRKMIYSPKSGAFLLAVHSSRGGSGCTSVALAICQELRRFRGWNTLYLSMEAFDSAGGYFSSTGKKGIREYLYYILTGQESKYAIVEGFLRSDDFGGEAFTPSSGKNPLKDLSEEDFRLFFSTIFAMGRYDAIIFDCGNCISESAICAMKIADKLLFITGEEEQDEKYISFLTKQSEHTVEDKMLAVINRHEEITGNLHEEDMEGDSPESSEVLTIAYDPPSFTDHGQKRNISLDTDFGTDVKNVLEVLMG